MHSYYLAQLEGSLGPQRFYHACSLKNNTIHAEELERGKISVGHDWPWDNHQTQNCRASMQVFLTPRSRTLAHLHQSTPQRKEKVFHWLISEVLWGAKSVHQKQREV